MRDISPISCIFLFLAHAAFAVPGAFLTQSSEFRLGESVMIPIRLDSPPEKTVTSTLESNRPGIIEILRHPEFLPGQTIGFARIRTLKPGTVALKHGAARMQVTVTTERPLSMVRQMRPRFTSPSAGSHVWGTIAIGAEMWVGAPGVLRDSVPAANLHLPNGTILKPDEAFPPVDGPFWRLVFHLDTSKLPPGECSITLSATPPIDGAQKSDILTSAPHTLHILPPATKDDIVFSGECEAALETPRTERMGNEPPGVIMDPHASGHRAVALRRRRPAWVIQPDIPTPGRYQLMVRARGTLAGSAYPSLGILLGKDASDSGSARLSSVAWHDVPVGRPLRLDAGPQWIGITLANEFNYRNQLQRTADIDHYTLRRVPDTSPTGDSSAMMAGAMMMEAGGNKKSESKQPRAHQLRIAFTHCADGEPIRGRTHIQATLTSSSLRSGKDFTAIRSELWINDELTSSAHGQNPSFTLFPHDFKKGTNTLQIRAVSPCGNKALSLTRTLVADSPHHPAKKPATTHKPEQANITGGQAALGASSLDSEVFVDASPPAITLLYPRPDAILSAAGDAIVLRAFDDLALSHFDIFIDGVKTPLSYPAGSGTGLVLLPIPGSLLPPGPRTIAVAAIDESGKSTRSATIRIHSRHDSGPQLTLAYPRAVRLARNLALGIDPRALAAILTEGESAWIDKQLASPHPEEPLVDALAETWFRDINDYNIRGRVATHLLNTRFPVRARFAQFAQNHFSTWISKTGAHAKWREHRAFLDVGPARFQDLLLTSATSPAMMVYLDQQNSFGKQLNENYARELMELHTVGVHAGYQQSDVTHLAKLLSGWGAQREATMDGTSVGYEYRYSPYLAEPGPLEVFGLSIPAAGSPDTADDRVRLAIEMLASRPQTARFFSEKLAAHYLGLPSDPSIVSALEHEFLRTGGNLRRMLALLATSPAMMASNKNQKVMPPVEFAVATQRSASANHPWSVISLADRSGRNLFDRASPDGFPESNDEYADSNYQLQKWRYCKELEWPLRNHLPSSAFRSAALADESHRDSLIDLAFAFRLGSPSSPTTRAALHKTLSQSIPDDNQRRNLFTSFLHMMPEFQSR